MNIVVGYLPLNFKKHYSYSGKIMPKHECMRIELIRGIRVLFAPFALCYHKQNT
jgi:hypothetical protein